MANVTFFSPDGGTTRYPIEDTEARNRIDNLVTGVSSFNGRSGSILPIAGDYDATQVVYDGNTTVKQKIDAILGDFAQIETSPTTHAYAIGNYLIYNNLLYRVTAAISVGGTLTVGTNITQTTAGSEITKLQNAIDRVLIWTNPNDPSASMDQAVLFTQDLSSYEYLIIICRFSNISNRQNICQPTLLYLDPATGGGASAQYIAFDGTEMAYATRRFFYNVSDNRFWVYTSFYMILGDGANIPFKQQYADIINSENYMIPYKIYGVKRII